MCLYNTRALLSFPVFYIFTKASKCLSPPWRNTCLLLRIGNEFCSCMNTYSFLTLYTNNLHVYPRRTRVFSSCVVVILWVFSCKSYNDTHAIIRKHENCLCIAFVANHIEIWSNECLYLHLISVSFTNYLTRDKDRRVNWKDTWRRDHYISRNVGNKIPFSVASHPRRIDTSEIILDKYSSKLSLVDMNREWM